MDINLTLLGQAITFALFVWFTMKFVWPPIIQALDERKQKIADGLAAAENGERHLAEAETQSGELIKEARVQAQHLMEEARHRAALVEDDGLQKGRAAGLREIQLAQTQIEQLYHVAQTALHDEAVALSLAVSKKVLAQVSSVKLHEEMIALFVKEVVATTAATSNRHEAAV